MHSEKRWINSLRGLLGSGPCGPIGVDNSATRDEGYGIGVHRAGKGLQETFASYFLWKIENPLSSCSISKYIADKQSRTGSTESRYIRKLEIQQLSMCKRLDDCYIQGQAAFFTCR